MNVITKTRDVGHEYMAPSCELFHIAVEQNVMATISGGKTKIKDVEEEDLDW